jgi:hypothetical protein
MISSPKSMYANGTIVHGTFVKLDPTVNNSVIAAGTNDKVHGIAQLGGRIAPTPDVTTSPYNAAQVGDSVMVHTNTMECLLLVGTGGWLAGDELTSASDGSGVKNPKTGHPGHIGAIALEAGNAGEYALVQVTIYNTPSSTYT